jgi:transposase
MDPAFHWTDSKIRVHALTCVLALLLVRIAHKRAKANGFVHGAERMMELLSGVRTGWSYVGRQPLSSLTPVFCVGSAA